MKIKKITDNDELIAIIVPADYEENGVRFITDEKSSFQLAYIRKSKESITKKHLHPDFERPIYKSQECLLVRKGKILIKFYNCKKEQIADYIAQSRDAVLFITGGHELFYLESSDVLEIRQGPYNEKLDKEYF